jgi:hypothetical protein
VRKNGFVSVASHRTTEHHWFTRIGRSRWLRTHPLMYGVMIDSEVGRTASRSSSSFVPASVTHATSGSNPSTISFSRSRYDSGMNMGKYAFCTPLSLNFASRKRLSRSQTAYARGRVTMNPLIPSGP